MVSVRECKVHGDEYMVYEDRQDFWVCLKCNYPELVDNGEED